MTVLNINDAESIGDWLCSGNHGVMASFSIARLAALIANALELDGLEIDARGILDILAQPMSEPVEQVNAATVFMHASDWIVALAEYFGFQGEADGFVDTAWLDGRPHMGAMYRALTLFGVRAMRVASDAYEAQHGHSMLEVFLASMETGEGFEQSRARLTARRNGLRAVK